MLIVKEAFYLKSQMRVSRAAMTSYHNYVAYNPEKCSLTVLEPGLLHQGVSSTMLPGKPGRTLLVSGRFPAILGVP